MREYGDACSGMNVFSVYLQILVCSVLLQICRCCSSDGDDSGCWYTLWYIWFVIGLFVVIFVILIILYIKHKTKERSRVRRLQRNHQTMPIRVVAPQGPPSYTEASHKPPTYAEAMQQPQMVNVRHVNEISRTMYTRPLPPGYGMVGGLPGVADDTTYANRPPPTSLRMVSVVPSTPQARPPSYRTSVHGQGRPT